MSGLDIEANRSATKYTKQELLLRVLWGVGKWAFRFSPRPCFGLRRGLLRLFGAEVGKNVHIYPSALVYYPWNLKIGDDSSIGEWVLVYNLGKVTIGCRATISQRAHLCAGTHDFRDPVLPLMKPPIQVGDDVWVCADVFVGPSVKIGVGAVLGARSVVTKDVEGWSVVAGNPAKFIKRRELEEKTKQ